jgi:PPOX class probable F420-dependent enzyme
MKKRPAVMPTSIAQHAYLSLATKKRDGQWVWTPIWFAKVASGALVAFSAGGAGKVKRLRNFSDIQVKPCTASGKPLGDASPGAARLTTDANECAEAYQALHAKYGWQMKALDFVSRLSGNFHKRQVLVIEGVL